MDTMPKVQETTPRVQRPVELARSEAGIGETCQGLSGYQGGSVLLLGLGPQAMAFASPYPLRSDCFLRRLITLPEGST